MTHVLEDRDLVVDREDWVFISAEELFFKNFDCGESGVLLIATEVDLRGVTLSETLNHLILSVKNGMSLPLLGRWKHDFEYLSFIEILVFEFALWTKIILFLTDLSRRVENVSVDKIINYISIFKFIYTIKRDS